MKHIIFVSTALCLLLLVGGLFYAEKMMKTEQPKRKFFTSEPPKENLIGIYHTVITLKKSSGLFFAALFGAFPIFIVSLQKFEISLAMIVFVIFTVFFYLLFYILSNFHLMLYNKLLIYSDGISSRHRILGKRIYLPFKEMITATYDDFSNEICINGQKREADLLIQLPLNNHKGAIEDLKKVAGIENCLVKELIRVIS